MATGQTITVVNHDTGETFVAAQVNADWRLTYTTDDDGVHAFVAHGRIKKQIPLGFGPTISDLVRAIAEAEGQPTVGEQTPAAWVEGQARDRWDEIIDEMEGDGAINYFSTSRAEIRRAMQRAVGEDRVNRAWPVIDLEKLYPAADLDGYATVFTEAPPRPDDTYPPHGQVRREDEGVMPEWLRQRLAAGALEVSIKPDEVSRERALDALAKAFGLSREDLEIVGPPRWRRFDPTLAEELKSYGRQVHDSADVAAIRDSIALTGEAYFTTENETKEQGND